MNLFFIFVKIENAAYVIKLQGRKHFQRRAIHL
jgi:hypothetical protein